MAYRSLDEKLPAAPITVGFESEKDVRSLLSNANE